MVKRNVEIDILVDDSQKSKLRGIGDEAGKTGGRFSQLSGAAKGVAGGLIALAATGIVRVLGEMTQAALEDNAAQVQLAVALKNTVGATNAQVTATEDWITKTTRITGITDNELRPALANLVRATGDLETAQEQMGDAMDIATAKGLPLEAVTTAMGKAANGNVGAMGRLGLKVRDTSGAFLSYEEILVEANRTMGGATTAAAESAEGQFRRMTVAVDEAKESIGNALIPILADGATALNNINAIAGRLGDSLDKLPGPIGKVVGGVVDWLGPFSALEKVTSAAVEQMDKVFAPVDAANEVIAVAADRYDEMSGSVDEATAALEDFEDEVRSQIDPMFNLISKVNDLDSAQSASAAARDAYGQGSLEHQAALRKEAEAWLAVKDAQIKAQMESGVTRETFRANLEAMQIFTRAEIDLMLADFDRVNNYTFADKTIQVNTRGDIVNRERTTGARAGGGPVGAGGTYLVGERGPELLHMGSQNGSVTPNNQLGRGGASYSISVNAGLGANGSQIGKEVVEAIKAFERTNGKTWRA